MIFIVQREKSRKNAIRYKKRFRWRAKRRTENNAAARSGKFPSGAAAREINKKRRAASPFFSNFRVSPVICFCFRSAGTETTGSFSAFANCQFIGNRGFSSPDFVPSGEAAVFSVPDALLRSPALFADEISYSARSELILVLCTILAKAPISRAER